MVSLKMFEIRHNSMCLCNAKLIHFFLIKLAFPFFFRISFLIN
jgi:hypothetical protein